MLNILSLNFVQLLLLSKDISKKPNILISHLSYCTSAWGGIQKRCVRLLFGIAINYDHSQLYVTCARARTIDQHKDKKNGHSIFLLKVYMNITVTRKHSNL